MLRLDRTATIRGEAWDAFAGAVIETADGDLVYLAGLDAWGQELVGRQIEATGTLRRRRIGPDPGGPAKGHGIAGESYVLDEATWRIAEK
jgi:hypothetical protein